MASSHKVLIISRRSKGEIEFVKKLKEINPSVEITLTTYLDIDIFVDRSGATIKLHELDIDVASFDLVYFKTTAKYPDLAASIASYLNKRGVKFIDKAAEFAQVTSKIYQYVVFSNEGIESPSTIYILRDRLKNSYEILTSKLGSPFVLKDNHGNKGKLNYLIDNQQAFDTAIKEAEELGADLVAQEYIDNDGDYRLLVFGDKVYLVIHREKTNTSTHLNNVSTGGRFKQVNPSDLPNKVIQQTIRSAGILNRQVAGIDMVNAKNSDDWYCLEVNEGPQISSGVLIEDKQAAFAKFLESYLD